MTSTIICGGTAPDRLEEAQKRAAKLSQGVDLIVLDSPTKIDDARAVLAALTRKPYQSKGISVILNGADNLTVEAQNALLKTLEEPPGESSLYLLVASKESLLPTVQSRCQALDLGPVETEVSLAKLKSAWKAYQSGDVTNLFDGAGDGDPTSWAVLWRQILLFSLGGEKLLSSQIKGPLVTEVASTRDLEQLSLALDTDGLRQFLALAQQTAADLKANVNHRLAMENLLLALPRPKTTVMN